MISDRTQVCKFYLHNEFGFDMLGLLSVVALSYMEKRNYDLDSAQANILKLLALLKFKSVDRITTKLQFLYATTTNRESNFRISMLMVKLLFFIHLLSLLFNGMRRWEKQ